MNRWVKLSMLMLVVALPCLALAQVKTEERGDRVIKTTPKDWLAHPSKDSYHTESWTAVLQADNGHLIYISYINTNIGVTSGRTAVNVSVMAPGQKSKAFKWEYDQDKFTVAQGSGTINVGPNSISLNGRKAKLKVAEKDFKMDVTVDSWVDGVSFYYGRTNINRADNEWTATWFHIPRGDVTGTINFGGKKVDMKGAGYIDHMVQNVLASEYSDSWMTARLFAKDHAVIAISFAANKAGGGKQWVRVLVVDRKGVVLLTDKGKVSGSKKWKDDDGYQYNSMFTLKSEEGKVKVEGTFTGKRLHDRVAVMEELGWAQRQVAMMVAGNPIAYRLEGDASVTLTVDGKAIPLTGKALMETYIFTESK